MAFINILLLVIFGALFFVIALPLLVISRLRGNMRHRQGTRRYGREGEVSVSGGDASAGDKIVGDNVGEYVDFEEVEDSRKQ